ncbi:MAG: oxidoreductase [Proteobacteria bacterium]|nr:oxidoreductase [Pseudomonadota bacterium]
MGDNQDHVTQTLDVSRVRDVADGIVQLELRDPAGQSLPRFDPGSHLEVYLPDDRVRHYSLCNDSRESHRYCIAVALAPNSRGGSRYVHENIRAGDTLTVSLPRNNFRLLPDARSYCFIAGGIGITPILCMVRWCVQHGKRWKLIYCARSRAHAAFFDELRGLGTAGDELRFHFDAEQGGQVLDTASATVGLAPNTHIYCCGPASLMNAVLESRGARSAELYHFEWFAPRTVAPAVNREFTVILRGSGQRLRVPGDRSILSVLAERGVSVPFSCREGICGTCETAVLSGVPDHRDSVLTPEQQKANSSMMICVSRAHSDTLELDL